MAWHDEFEVKEEEIAGRQAFIALPAPGTANGRWALKTEYFDDFPAVQCELLRCGWHVAHITSKTRWYVHEDNCARAELASYMRTCLGLSEKCAVIGMSCGGMQGIYFASEYPQLVSCLYLDAPVINLLSCPAGLGVGTELDAMEEFKRGTGMGISELLSYRDHPLDRIPSLINNNIPIILVSGDSDRIVPYEENGRLLDEAYKKAGCEIKTIIKRGSDHHPHSLENNEPIIDFIKTHSK